MDFLKSSNDSGKFGLGSKPVLGQRSLETSSPSDDSDSRSENIQLDINDLQPAVVNNDDLDKVITEDYSEDPSDSFAVGAKHFIKKETKKSTSVSETSKSSSKTSSKTASKSVSKSRSKSVTKSASKGLPTPVVEQIDAKKIELTRDIEAEMKKVQMELHEQRERRYAEIMTSHEEEMYRKSWIFYIYCRFFAFRLTEFC